MRCRPALLLGALAALGSCQSERSSSNDAGANTPDGAPGPVRFDVVTLARFDEPWAMTFLPDGRLLVTEKGGRLQLFAPGGGSSVVAGTPAVAYGGQGGLGDVILHPRYAENRLVYLSWAEPGEGDTRGAAIGRARLVLDAGPPRLDGLEVIWRQTPKVTGGGHYGHRMAFAPDGHLYVTSGDRQKLDPAQELDNNLGKILRLTEAGAPAADNPFAARGPVAAQIWSYGHRNPLGLAFDAQGRLWAHEMGPLGGDELNLIERGSNYGWPLVSNGDHSDRRPIPDHDTRPDLNAPEVTWTPVIAPAGFVIYGGNQFPAWRGSGLLAGLTAKGVVRVELAGTTAREVERLDFGARIREIEESKDGGLYVLEDGSDARLLQLVPRP